MTKVYIANTPLILEDAQGSQFRVELGEKVELTPEQYESVAAHVTPVATTDKEPEQQAAVNQFFQDSRDADNGCYVEQRRRGAAEQHLFVNAQSE